MLWFTCVLIQAMWTVDISLGSSVKELLTRVAGVLGSIPSPALCFNCIYMPTPPFLLKIYLCFIVGVSTRCALLHKEGRVRGHAWGPGTTQWPRDPYSDHSSRHALGWQVKAFLHNERSFLNLKKMVHCSSKDRDHFHWENANNFYQSFYHEKLRIESCRYMPI